MGGARATRTRASALRVGVRVGVDVGVGRCLLAGQLHEEAFAGEHARQRGLDLPTLQLLRGCPRAQGPLELHPPRPPATVAAAVAASRSRRTRQALQI